MDLRREPRGCIVALWRSGRSPVLTVRTSVRKDVAELRVRLDDLAATVPMAVQSRQRVASAVGGMGSALDQFCAGADKDKATIESLQKRLGEIECVPLLAGYGALEGKVTAVQEVRTRVDQLAEKYAEAADADGKIREHLRAAALGRVNRS